MENCHLTGWKNSQNGKDSDNDQPRVIKDSLKLPVSTVEEEDVHMKPRYEQEAEAS